MQYDISAKDAFRLFDTFGFPLDMTIEIAKEKNLTVDIDGFYELFKQHQILSKSGSDHKFKGGVGENTIEATHLHTATHLLQAGLRKVLGDHVRQKGSNITSERLRFDFSHPAKMTPEEIKAVEDYVNEAIEKGIEINKKTIKFDDALTIGALIVPNEEYNEDVDVYNIDGYSLEVCGGPHAKNTADMGKFKITKEESSSAGVRRIKAILVK